MLQTVFDKLKIARNIEVSKLVKVGRKHWEGWREGGRDVRVQGASISFIFLAPRADTSSRTTFVVFL